ncbi:MAG: hypothetical protein MRERC_2c100 [Mycoplasmataceae bacterium RC_NB112A]|nr:MAG: hypothetical protein MRERC_2c100 [Mycoplasmataceae bacterium RC_NB112A]
MKEIKFNNLGEFLLNLKNIEQRKARLLKKKIF